MAVLRDAAAWLLRMRAVRLKPLPKARELRIWLRLAQEEFAAHTHIPPGAHSPLGG
jgi:hypothetical protein